MEEVQRVAKVGSKRTPSHPVPCSEAQGGREGSERRLYPQMREQWPSCEGKRKPTSPRPSGDQIRAVARAKAHLREQIR